MIKTGKQVRCDRCGLLMFYEDGGLVGSIGKIEMDGWEERLGKNLCRDCTAAFDEMTKTFFGEFWDK